MLKDAAGLEGDMKIGLPTLAAKRGPRTAVRVGALFYLFAAIALPLPYVVGVVTIAYLIPIALLGLMMVNSAVSLFRKPAVQNVEKQRENTLTTAVLLFPIALVAGTVFSLSVTRLNDGIKY